MTNDELQRVAYHSFTHPEVVTPDSFLLVEHLLDKWFDELTSSLSHSLDEELKQKLNEEAINPDLMEQLKQALIGYATITRSSEEFMHCIRLLARYHDPSLVPVLRTWLSRNLRKYKAVTQLTEHLINALENSGESIRTEETLNNASGCTCDDYLDACSYLAEVVRAKRIKLSG